MCDAITQLSLAQFLPVFGRCRAGIQLGELEALEQLPLLVQQQRFQRQAGLAVQVQLEAVAMLVARGHREDHCRAAGDTGFADQAQVVPGSQLGRIELAHRPQLGIGQLVGKAAADALGAPIDPDHFLARASSWSRRSRTAPSLSTRCQISWVEKLPLRS